MLLTQKAIGTVGYLCTSPVVYEEHRWSCVQMTQCNAEFLGRDGNYVYSCRGDDRSDLVAQFKGEWLLMLHQDIAFEPDLLIRLIDRHDRFGVDVITSFGLTEVYPFGPALYGSKDGAWAPVGDWPDTPFSVGASATGCLMVWRKALDRVQSAFRCRPFFPVQGASEDLSFFERCRQLHIDVLCDPRIHTRKLSVRSIEMSDLNRSAIAVI